MQTKNKQDDGNHVVFPSCFANIKHPCEVWEPDSAADGFTVQAAGTRAAQTRIQIVVEMFLYEQLIKGIMLFLSHLICFLLLLMFAFMAVSYTVKFILVLMVWG